MWKIAFTALLAATFVSAAVAHADSASDYVAAVTSQGVIADRDALIGAADDLYNAAVQQNQGGIFVGISPNIAAASALKPHLDSTTNNSAPSSAPRAISTALKTGRCDH